MAPSSETLRKAAIVIASLDEAAADKLLESMPEEVASRIRWMSVELEDVSEEERRTVLDEFLRNSGRPTPPVDEGVELAFTYTEPSRPEQTSGVPTPPPFAFLNDAPGEMLAPFFEQEHPQVTAVVMSYLKPDRASDILRHLPAAVQADVVLRITQLDEPSQEIVADIEARIRQIVSRQSLSFERRRMGLAAAQAILKAATGDQAQQLREELRTRGLEIPAEAESKTPSAARPEFSFLPPAPAQRPTAVDVSDQREKLQPEATPSLKPMATPPETPVVPAGSSRSPSTIHEKAVALQPKTEPEVRQPKFPFERFAYLDDASLAKVLHHAGPKVVLLALCGASPAVMKRISRGLGGTDVSRLEAKIRQMQPVLLADIDRAQREMCLAADALLGGGNASSSSGWQAAA